MIGWEYIDHKKSGTGRSRIGADSVLSRVGSGRGLGRVGDGSGSCWGRLRVKSVRLESGSGSSRGRVGVVLKLTPCEVGPGRVGVWVESGTGRGRVGVDSRSSRVGKGLGLGRVGVRSTTHTSHTTIPHTNTPPHPHGVKPLQIETPIGMELRFQRVSFFERIPHLRFQAKRPHFPNIQNPSN